MGKVKMKRKSTLIDMTAMSDVTVLLLTFFMLTSTFLAKEPVQVITPSSVSEIKVPDTNVVNILVSPKGEVYLALTGDADAENAETMGSEAVRKEVLRDVAKRYKDLTGKDVGLTPMDIEKFAKQPSFGIPLEKMHEFLTLDQTKQDNWLSGKDLKTNPAHVTGIPLTDITYKDENGNVLKTNEFQIWMRAIYNNASNQNIHDAIQRGEGINVKADRGTKFETMHPVLDNLQTIKMNKFSIMTALKTEAD